MKLSKLCIISLCFMSGLSLFGQIVIDWNEIPHNVGTQWIKNSAIDVTVSLGTTGGPQTWDFTSQPMGGEFSYATIVEPSASAYQDSFPSANLVYCSPGGSDTVYQYYNLNSNYIIMLGLGAASPTTPFVWKYDPSDSIPCPQSYSNSYNFHYGFREDILPTTYMEYYHHGVSVYDAYGTVNIPYGSYNCLRARTYDTCKMTIYANGTPIFSDSITFINYQFVTENYGAVVCVKSDTNETDPNYTDAFILERLTLFLSGIEDNENLNEIQCSPYPELFSDYTTIQYTLPEQSHVELAFYDMSGRKVNTLVEGTQGKGNYLYRWCGNDDGGKLLGSGIYLYQLKAGNKIHTGKVALIR
jgi:hypothetical protein